MISTLESIKPNLTSALEYCEATYWGKLYDSKTNLNCVNTVIAGAFVGALPELDILALNRVLGLGMEFPVKPTDIDRIIRFYEAAGSKRFFIQLSPYAYQDDLPEILYEKGLKPYNNWVKLLRLADKPLNEYNTSLEVIEITPERAQIYGQIIFDSFDWEDDRLIDWLAASVGKPGYYHYLVLNGNKAIAAGALHVMNNFASMALAGTLPEYRGVGAQSLLLRTRISKARQLGCKYIVSETAEDKPDNPVASFRNMRRFGFETVYLRQNWLYEI